MIKYDNDFEMNYDDILKKEQEIYDEYVIRNRYHDIKVDFNLIKQRDLDYIYDKIYNLPQAIFCIKIKKNIIVGRKLRSELSINGKINAAHCSKITPSMILGVYKSKEQKGKDVCVSFYPMTEEERISTFNIIKSDINNEINFLFQERDYYTNQVEKTDKFGWSLNPNKVKYLGYGETHLRKYTNNRFVDIFNNNVRVYDPACSTGQFLYDIKKKYPQITTIGGDLSKQMIDYAKDYLDEWECCNAKDSKIEENSVDVLFLRFLNDQVVSKYQAKKILPNVLKKLKTNGIAVAFGHTPVLLTKKQFEKFGLKVEQCMAYQDDVIFQYYVMRKI